MPGTPAPDACRAIHEFFANAYLSGHTKRHGELRFGVKYEMSRSQKAGIISVAIMCLGFSLHELRHFQRYGHIAPLGLHVDVSVATSNEVLGVEGIAKIYRARLTNYGIIPSSLRVCSERIVGVPAIDLNYIVERWDRQSGSWRAVPEWDFGGYRLFCRPVFEVTDQHVVSQRLWPGQSLYVGEGIPGQLGGFQIGDEGRFTVLLNADGDKTHATSTSAFLVDQEPRKRHVPTHEIGKP